MPRTVRTRLSRDDFFAQHGLEPGTRTVVLLPGSRAGEVRRHLPVLLKAIAELRRNFSLSVLLATPQGFHPEDVLKSFGEPIQALSVRVVEGQTWDAIGHADIALAACGTVTVEAAVLGTPMVTFYKVNSLSWWAGRRLVTVPFFSMVNLIAGREIIPELIQHRMTAANIAHAAGQLLTEPERVDQMRADLASVRGMLASEGDPFSRAAELILKAPGLSHAVERDRVRETIR